MTITATAPVAHTLAEVLDSEFQSARAELHRARDARRVKDTPANRAAVDSALARLDAILDVFLDAQGA